VCHRAVPGLHYDPSRKQVIYQNGTAQVICAEDSTFLWATGLRETGQGPLRVSVETRDVDNGFNGHERTVGKVVLELHASGPTAISDHSAE